MSSFGLIEKKLELSRTTYLISCTIKQNSSKFLFFHQKFLEKSDDISSADKCEQLLVKKKTKKQMAREFFKNHNPIGKADSYCGYQCHESRKRHLRRPHFSKRLSKLAILPDYKCPRMLCLALPARRKVRKLDFQSEFSMSKIIRISLIFFLH